MNLRLSIHRNGLHLGDHDIDPGQPSLRIGSMANADIHIPHFPRVRAKLHMRAGEIQLLDVGRGMRVNGEARHRTTLAVGDTIELDDVVLQVVDPSVPTDVLASSQFAEAQPGAPGRIHRGSGWPRAGG